jgi:hypothetical protein
MPIWVWLLLLGLIFLITYDKRAGRLHDFFEPEIVDDGNSTQRKTQSGGDTDELR